MERIPEENPGYEKAYRKNVDCHYCGCEIFQQYVGSRWMHAGRHSYENYWECKSLTVATPRRKGG